MRTLTVLGASRRDVWRAVIAALPKGNVPNTLRVSGLVSGGSKVTTEDGVFLQNVQRILEERHPGTSFRHDGLDTLPYQALTLAVKERCEALGVEAEAWRFLQRIQVPSATHSLVDEVLEGHYDQHIQLTAEDKKRADHYYSVEKNWQ